VELGRVVRIASRLDLNTGCERVLEAAEGTFSL
jgi:hypothetical protein